jgi:parallel beta-helix repeat protein
MSQPSWIGQKLGGRYEIEELVGRGGMSAVYKGTDPNLRRTVAIKLIHSHLSEDPQFVSRFEVEAAAVAQLKHPNVIQVFDFDHDEDTYYMVLEFIPGETLQERLKRLGAASQRLSPKEAIKIAASICDALDYAHKRGMIHRDVKPANIMLSLQGQAILMDFGIAKIIGGKEHTATGAVVGTAMYMSPEQAKGELPDARVDVYALGVTLFEMLSGRPPFESDSAMTLMMMHVNDPVPDLSEITPDVPQQLVAVVGKALAKDREQRFQTAADFASALRSIDLQKVAGGVIAATTIEEQSSEEFAPTTIEPVEQPEVAAQPGPTAIEELQAEAPPPRPTPIEETEGTAPRRGVMAALTEAAGGRRGIVVGGGIIGGVLAIAILGAGGYLLFSQTGGDEAAAAASPTPLATSTPTPILALLVPEDHATIQEAIDAAEDGDVIVVSPGTYGENIDFSGKNIILRSTDPGDPEVVAATTLDGGGLDSVVIFQGGETAEARLEGFTITQGQGRYVNGGGIWVLNNSSPTISSNTIFGNEAVSGGGILVEANSSPTITGNTIRENQAEFGGGGIAVFDSSPTIENNTISSNVTEQFGGGIVVSENASPKIERNTISDNQAKLWGGGIAVFDSSAMVVSNEFQANTAGSDGGSIYVSNSSPTISDNTMNGNRARSGGGITVSGESSPTIEDNIIIGNRAEQTGGGIHVRDLSSPIILGNTISDNQAQFGGGIAAENSTPTISGNIITENRAEFGGGGIAVFDTSLLMIEFNTISNNQAEAGGGIAMEKSSPTIKDNSISDNQANLSGGGIDVFDNSSPMVVSNEIQSNTAGNDGGGIWVSGDSTLILSEPDDNIYSANQPDNIYYSPD